MLHLIGESNKQREKGEKRLDLFCMFHLECNWELDGEVGEAQGVKRVIKLDDSGMGHGRFAQLFDNGQLWVGAKLCAQDVVDVLLVKGHGPNLLLSIETNGQLVALEGASMEVVWRLSILVDGAPPRSLYQNDHYLYMLAGDRTLIVLLLESLRQRTDDCEGMLVELPVGRVEDLCPAPCPSFPPDFAAPAVVPSEDVRYLLVVGRDPMLSIVALPSLHDSLLDPLLMAKQFLGDKLSGWLGRVRGEGRGQDLKLRDNLTSRFSRGMATRISFLDDPPRTLAHILPMDEQYLLFDVQNGRALLYDPRLGLFIHQRKGLRNCELVVGHKDPEASHSMPVPLSKRSVPFACALHRDRKMVELLPDLQGGAHNRSFSQSVNRTVPLPANCHNPTLSKHDNIPYLASFLPDKGGASLRLYKFSLAGDADSQAPHGHPSMQT